MRAFLKALILLPMAIVVVLLAVANRGPVTLSLDPFSGDAPEVAFRVPLYALVFGAVALGTLIGGIASWLAQGKNRRSRREARREVGRLKAETERLRQRTEAHAASGPALPAPSRF
ncbi:MAG TPA: lipopolysaccharide assembly protein LapA domain-containing protein [Beijerinckiaceae bacterium]|jgi:uncharacterized integral membrane protein